MSEIIINRGMFGVWNVIENGEFITNYEATYKAGDVFKSLREHYPNARLGVRASDIGPIVAMECMKRGFGNILWMK